MIGFLIIATGNYYKYLPNLIRSIERFYPKDVSKKYYIFTNHKLKLNFIDNYEIIYFEHKPFPSSTLFRFHEFNKIRDKLVLETERLCYIDSDSLIVRNPPMDFLDKEIYGFEHGVNITSNVFDLPYERNAISTAHVGHGYERKYIIGGLWGGTTKRMISMFQEMEQNINADLNANLIACFHDESHINKYFIKNQDSFIYDTKYVLGETDGYNNLKIWTSDDTLENCRDEFIRRGSSNHLIAGEHFAIFLTKDHHKERSFYGPDQQIILT